MSKSSKTNSNSHSINNASNALVQAKGHTSSNYSITSQPSSRSSDSRTSDTLHGATNSTLFPPPLPPNASALAANGGQPNGGDVTATDNVMNTVADASSSLFQICVTLRQRLHGVPGLDESLLEEEEDADEDTDPVTLLWRTFRRGYPLMLLYNALRPDQPLVLKPDVREDKKGKVATFKFLQACINDLKFPQEECFIITDLYGDDTTGFVKVARVVNRVLDIMVSRGLIADVQPTPSDFEQAAKGIKRTQRQHIISELVNTERTYVQHLDLLQAFKKLVEEKGAIPGDAVHDIFLNLNSLLDFQRRFLIRVEQTNSLPEEEQNWGKLFVLYNEAFKVYEPYIANQRKCEKTVVANFPALAGAASSSRIEMRQMVESPTSLYGFLMKPFQRLSKYPLLLDDLFKKGDLDAERKHDLLFGKEAATSVLARTNLEVDRYEKAEAVEELKSRVEDWKGHRVEGFGELLLYGTFTVVKSETMGTGKDGERHYHVYLFETILLCCKDIDMNKPKNKNKRGKPKLQLKGRIFMQNVTDLIYSARPGSYTCQIFWKGDPSIENFIIRFTTEDMMKKWVAQIEAQRRMPRNRSGRSSESSRSLGTSATEFEFMRNQPAMENPYKQVQEEEDEEDDVETVLANQARFHPYQSSFGDSRNASSSSLRSRSTTGDSSTHLPATLGRQPAPRFPPGAMPQPSLTLRTREALLAQSPAEVPESYFSPIDGSPSAISSSRTSASSGMYSFPITAQQGRAPNGYHYEDAAAHQHPANTRFTAPALARQREVSGGGPPNGYQASGPPGRGPRPGLHSAATMPGGPRNRSASSPDVQNQPRSSAQARQPPVPDMPAPYAHNPAHAPPRSPSNSPQLGILPSRGPRDLSPEMQRERYRAHQQPQTYPPFDQSRNGTPQPVASAFHPPTLHESISAPPAAPSSNPHDSVTNLPTQFKIRVNCPSASQTLTLVVAPNISYQSLKDRIDAKLQRSTNLSLSDRGPKENQVKLKFLDEEDYVSIQSDEDVQMAFETWREQSQQRGLGEMAEIELFCQR